MNLDPNEFELFAGIDAAKGKGDAAIYKTYRDRNRKSIFVRKKIRFRFSKSGVSDFLGVLRKYKSESCTHITIALEVTGVFSANVFDYIHKQLSDDEDIRFLNPAYVNSYRENHNFAKSDPLDAQTIAQAIAEDSAVQYVLKNDLNTKNGYIDLKLLTHRYSQITKTLTQETQRLIARCDQFFPELEQVFEPKSATYLAILSIYPTTHDIMNADINEVSDVAYEASKHRCSIEKIETLLSLAKDTIVPDDMPENARDMILENVESVRSLRVQKESLKKMAIAEASRNPDYPFLVSITGIGPICAALILGEIYDITLFKDAEHFASYTGLTPRIKKSGTSIDTHGKISKKGPKILRGALYQAAEYARRHNPVLKHIYERIKNGNKKRHKLAIVAVANRLARYVYSVLKHHTMFVIHDEQIQKLPEETRKTFFKNITTEIPDKCRKKTYRYCDQNGQIFEYVNLSSRESSEVQAT